MPSVTPTSALSSSVSGQTGLGTVLSPSDSAENVDFAALLRGETRATRNDSGSEGGTAHAEESAEQSRVFVDARDAVASTHLKDSRDASVLAEAAQPGSSANVHDEKVQPSAVEVSELVSEERAKPGSHGSDELAHAASGTQSIRAGNQPRETTVQHISAETPNSQHGALTAEHVVGQEQVADVDAVKTLDGTHNQPALPIDTHAKRVREPDQDPAILSDVRMTSVAPASGTTMVESTSAGVTASRDVARPDAAPAAGTMALNRATDDQNAAQNSRAHLAPAPSGPGPVFDPTARAEQPAPSAPDSFAAATDFSELQPAEFQSLIPDALRAMTGGSSTDSGTLDGLESLSLASSSAVTRTAAVLPPAVGAGLSEASGPMAQLDTNADEWVQDLGAELLHIREGGDTRLRLNLAPGHLGSVQFDLAQTEQGIELRVVADSAAARDLLQQHSDTLRERMEQAGLQLAGFHCESGQREQGGESTAGHRFATGSNDSGDEKSSHVTVRLPDSTRILDLYA